MKPKQSKEKKVRNNNHGKSKCCKARINYNGGGYDGEDVVPVVFTCSKCGKQSPGVIQSVGRPTKVPF